MNIVAGVDDDAGDADGKIAGTTVARALLELELSVD